MSTFVLTAGGTGGHLFPAEALAKALQARGHTVVVITDARGVIYTETFAGCRILTVPSAALSGRSLAKLAAAPFKILAGVAASLRHLRVVKPQGVIGFGGYPSVPIMLAACLLRLPTAIVSPDALLGRANRLVMNRVDRIAANFPLVRFLPKDGTKVVYTGNPLRPAAMALANAPYVAPAATDSFRLLIFGGSQGARFFSDVMPAALALLPPETLRRLKIVQQCRAEDLDGVRQAYARMGADVELAPFFKDMPERIAAAHLVIARAGAGTVSELAAIGRPAILVPLPYALDDNQTPNAEALVTAGGGWRIAQKDLSPEKMAERLTAAMSDPQGLARRAEAVRILAKPDAANRLADLAERLEKTS